MQMKNVYTVEREFLGKITKEELVKKIINAHQERDTDKKKASWYLLVGTKKWYNATDTVAEEKYGQKKYVFGCTVHSFISRGWW